MRGLQDGEESGGNFGFFAGLASLKPTQLLFLVAAALFVFYKGDTQSKNEQMLIHVTCV